MITELAMFGYESFLVLSVVVFKNVLCNELSLNEIIDSLPTDAFVKVFLDGERPQNILETRTPIMLWYNNRPGWTSKHNKKYLCKFFPVGRNIGSRTHYIINIVQINLPIVNNVYIWPEPKMRILNMVTGTLDNYYWFAGKGTPECNFAGSNSQTILLGNNALYKSFMDELYLLLRYLGGFMYKHNTALLFDLRNHSSRWKVCRIVLIGYDRNERFCVDSPMINHRTFDPKPMTKLVWGEIKAKQRKPLPPIGHFELRKHYYERSLNVILAREVFVKYNASFYIRDGYEVNPVPLAKFGESSDSLVFVDDVATNFLSCYTAPVLKFEMYVNPFESNVWLCLGSCVSIIAIFIYIYNRMKKLSPSFSPFFFFASTLVEEPYSVPTALWNDSKFKIITIAWLLTAVIFTNLYAGLMITELSVPLKGEILHSLDDVFGPYHKNESLNKSSPEDLLRNLFSRLIGKPSSELLRIVQEGLDHPRYKIPDPFDRPSLEKDLNFWMNDQYTNLYILHEVTFKCSRYVNYADYETFHRQFQEAQHFALLPAPFELCVTNNLAGKDQKIGQNFPTKYKVFEQFLLDAFQLDSRSKRFTPKYEYWLSKLMSIKHRHYPSNPEFPNSKIGLIKHFMAAATEKEVVACGRSIFVAELNELQAELLYLQRNYPDRTFYVGNDTIEKGTQRKLVWEYTNNGDPKLAEYFRILLQAGIRTHVSNILNHKLYLERRIGTAIIKEMETPGGGMDMNGSIQTIFIISAAILLLASSVFLIEFIHYRWKTIHTVVKRCGVMFTVEIRRSFTKPIGFNIIAHSYRAVFLLVKYVKTYYRSRKD
jgi:hypothetical protein